jgi:signal transduction histidine kinase/ligand-binding sensor domain-containing protein
MVPNAKTASGSLPSVLVPAGPVIGLGLVLVWSTVVSWGSELSANTSEYSIENWQLEQGLPQISVTSIAQTPDGYLWLGTFNGLVRFDGVRFTVFDNGNTPNLGSSGITQLAVDDEGALWIVTVADALVRMAAGEFTAIPREDGLPSLGGAYLLHDPSHRLLLLDREGELRRIENSQLRPLDRLDPLRTADAPCLLIGQSTGATRVAQRGKITRSLTVPVLADPGNSSNRMDLPIDCAAASHSGGYWLATGTGIYRLQQGQLSDRLAPLPSGVTELFFLREDGQGNLWAARWGKGIYRLDAQGSWQEFSAGTGMADNYVTCLFRDREGNLWAGSGQGGLYQFCPHIFHVYHTGTGASSDVVTSVTQDRQERMWFGLNGGGVHEWASGRLKPVTEPALLRSYPLAYSVLADHQDAVWIGLYGDTVLRLLAGTVTPYKLSGGSSQAMTPQALFEDHAGIIWLGCSHSLLRYEDRRFTRYTCREGLSCDHAVALAEDRAGGLYIGTDGGGLNCLRKGGFTAWTERDGLADNHVSSLYVDREDTLWIGTVNGGLSRFKKGRFTTVTIADGLPSNTIGALLEDDLGNLWLGSNRGIIRVNRQALNDYADGNRRLVSWDVFGLSDGLSTIGCTGSSQPACWKARDGKLRFATIKGAAMVDPNHLPFNPLPPPVVIEQVVMDHLVCDLQSSGSKAEGPKTAGSKGRALTNPSSATGTPGLRSIRLASALASPLTLTVPPRTHRVEFHFTGLSLVAPQKVRFRYRLDPFDRDWTEAGTRRVAYYTGIPPGQYQFRVTACNNDAVWNEEGARLSLVVLASWWMTWWFRALMVLGVAGVVLGWYEQRLHRLRRERAVQTAYAHRLIVSQEEERKRIAAELHDSLGQDLLVIKNRALLGLQQTAAAPNSTEQFNEISRMASHTLEEMREISRNLRPYQIDRLGLTKALESMVAGVSRGAALRCVGEFDSIDGWLPGQFEIHFYRIAQELLNNVVKHSDASECRIKVKRQDRQIILTVEDDGRGFDHAATLELTAAQRGLGLSDITERVRILGGTWQCNSGPGHGARWRIEIPAKSEPPHDS